jgi:hypothetical protein
MTGQKPESVPQESRYSRERKIPRNIEKLVLADNKEPAFAKMESSEIPRALAHRL